MKRISVLLAWGSVLILGALAALNWPIFFAMAPVNLVIAQVELPIGVVVLTLVGVPFVLFFVSYLHMQISSLLETRRLLKEVQRAHEVADKAEASRIENLHQFISTEFRLLNSRLEQGTVVVAPPPADAVADVPGPTGLTRLLPSAWQGSSRS